MSDASDGLTVVDKAPGMTSHDVVARFRRIARTRRVGHAGTLDPMATGVLVLAIGRATKLLRYLDLDAKRYEARIRLGQATTTDDADGEIVSATSARALDPSQVNAAMAAFVGEIMQVPATVSAIKIAGERAYKRARAGETVELAARPVTVRRFEARSYANHGELLDVDVVVECTAGTYVRSLARDLGRALGTGGHLVALRRTQVGGFSIDEARTLEALATLDDPVAVPMAAAVRTCMAVREVNVAELTELSFGRALDPTGIAGMHAAIAADGSVAALLCERDGRARPVLVFVGR